MGQFYFGDLERRWVNIQSALTWILSHDLRLAEHPNYPPHPCVSLIPRQATVANKMRLAREEKIAVLAGLKIDTIHLLPLPAAE